MLSAVSRPPRDRAHELFNSPFNTDYETGILFEKPPQFFNNSLLMSEQPLDIQPLLKAAEAALSHAVAPSSGFRVGAALLTQQGPLFTGCNIESPVYLGMCAERVSLFKALSEGFRKFVALGIVCEEGVPCPPCGTCRQLLWEFAPGLQIVLVDKSGIPQFHTIENLLPNVFERGGRNPFRNKDLS